MTPRPATPETPEAWLRRQLGTRFRGVHRDTDGRCYVEARKQNGKLTWWYGASEAEALEAARRELERLIGKEVRDVR